MFELSLGLVSLLRQSVALQEQIAGQTVKIVFHNSRRAQVTNTSRYSYTNRHSDTEKHTFYHQRAEVQLGKKENTNNTGTWEL